MGKQEVDLVVSMQLNESVPDGSEIWLAWKFSGKPTEDDNEGFTSPDKPSIMGANSHDRRKFELRCTSPQPGAWVIAVGSTKGARFEIWVNEIREAWELANAPAVEQPTPSAMSASGGQSNLLESEKRLAAYELYNSIDVNQNGFLSLDEFERISCWLCGATDKAAHRTFLELSYDGIEMTLTQVL